MSRNLQYENHKFVVFKLQCTSEAPVELVQTLIADPYPQFLISYIWEHPVICISRWCWYFWFRADILKTADLDGIKLTGAGEVEKCV